MKNNFREIGKLDHIKLMTNKTIDEVIKDEFHGLSGVFILAKLKAFILKFMPEYMNFLVDKLEKQEIFNPETFGFVQKVSKNINKFTLWQLDDYELLIFKDNFCKMTVKHGQFSTDVFLGKIPSYSFAFQLFQNLGVKL